MVKEVQKVVLGNSRFEMCGGYALQILVEDFQFSKKSFNKNSNSLQVYVEDINDQIKPFQLLQHIRFDCYTNNFLVRDYLKGKFGQSGNESIIK